jgi:transcriptional regulator GlxA family with amidase domain
MKTRVSLWRSFFVFSVLVVGFLIFRWNGTWHGSSAKASAAPNDATSQKPPHAVAGKPISVAFVLGDGATVIDFSGPWEVFQDAGGPDGTEHFHLFTVAASKAPIRASGGMIITPEYSFADAPPAQIVVIPAHRGAPELMNWLRERDKQAEVVMSVCTGAFQLGKAGLLDGKQVTTHHDFYNEFEKDFPKARLVKGRRYVQSDDVIYTAGGLTSGIDLALHIVEQYLGSEAAQKTADYMEYQGTGWKE